MDFPSLRSNIFRRVPGGPTEQPLASIAYSDIVSHLPVLEYYASLCGHCVEFGVRDAHSTVALISGCKGSVVSYDICEGPAVQTLKSLELPCAWEFVRADTADSRLVIPWTDLIFFDTAHTYSHLSAELRLHAKRASRFLIFHDTSTCGEFDRTGPDPDARGITPAIRDWREAHPEYEIAYQTDWNNGLLILERKRT